MEDSSALPAPLLNAIDLHARVNGPRTNWLPAFLDFLGRIRITSKESTEPIPIVPYDAQKITLAALCDALDNGVHRLTSLKARQLGITTILLALDIFWLQVHPGTRGALIMDSGDNRDAARATITEMLENLPRGYRVPVKTHNRIALTLKNGSVLQYMAAGKRKNSSLGRSRALNFIHASEVSSWGDQKGLETLLSALADENPNRLYLFESTALGHNLFHEMVNEAKIDPSQAYVFTGWWAKSTYAFRIGSREYEHYWESAPGLSQYEARITAQVRELYRWEISTEQWAWYRWKATQIGDHSLKEEFPSTEFEAFQATGATFFSGQRITGDLNFIQSHNVRASAYKCVLADDFSRMVVKKADSSGEADLFVWEEPNPIGVYVVGVDPAFGGEGENPDRTVISVWRCYADKLVQVAEYATTDPTTQQCAWVMAYLCACYSDCMVNIEVNGPGAQVMAEIKYLRQRLRLEAIADPKAEIARTTALDGIRWFLFRRVDQSGAGFNYNWRTDTRSKLVGMNRMRDAYNQEQLVCRSTALLGEMQTLKQDKDKIAAPGRKKDDRVMSAMLATYAWTEYMRPGLMRANRTFVIERARQAEIEKQKQMAPSGRVVDGIVSRHFHLQEKARLQERMRAIIEG